MKYSQEMAQCFATTRNGKLDSTRTVLGILKDYTHVCGPDGGILDIGCGPGDYARQLSAVLDPGISIHLLDHSASMLELAELSTNGLPNVYFTLADACAIPYSADTFSLCYAVNVFHQIEDKWAALCEIARVLRNHGVFVLVTPSRSRLRDFPLFAANVDLAVKQEDSLPDIHDIRRLIEQGPLPLRHVESKSIRGDDLIPASMLVGLIRKRFLSILADCANASIELYADNTESFLRTQGRESVEPYWSDVCVLRKECIDGHCVEKNEDESLQ